VNAVVSFRVGVQCKRHAEGNQVTPRLIGRPPESVHDARTGERYVLRNAHTEPSIAVIHRQGGDQAPAADCERCPEG